MIIVADASPLLHLARIGMLDLVRAAVGPVLVPRTVWGEVTESPVRPDVLAAIRGASWIDVVDDPPSLDLGLDPGETAAILLCEKLRADALLIDERRGRAVAIARGIRVIGTLGVVAAAHRNGAVERVAPVIEALRADGFWLSGELLEAFLASVGEKP